MRGWTRVGCARYVVREVELTALQREIVLDLLEALEGGRSSGVLDEGAVTVHLAPPPVGRGGGKSTIICTLNEIDRRGLNLDVLIDEGRRG